MPPTIGSELDEEKEASESNSIQQPIDYEPCQYIEFHGFSDCPKGQGKDIDGDLILVGRNNYSKYDLMENIEGIEQRPIDICILIRPEVSEKIVIRLLKKTMEWITTGKHPSLQDNEKAIKPLNEVNTLIENDIYLRGIQEEINGYPSDIEIDIEREVIATRRRLEYLLYLSFSKYENPFFNTSISQLFDAKDSLVKSLDALRKYEIEENKILNDIDSLTARSDDWNDGDSGNSSYED
jgi:hypothetical protein